MSALLDQDFPPLVGKTESVPNVKRCGVHRKLMQARLELQGRKLNKSGHNKFAGYNYFELGDFIPTIQEIFNGLGLCGIVSYGKEEAWLTITDTDSGSSTAVCSPMSTAALKGCHEVQNLGAVQTYIRRYLWVTAMEIVEHDALEATTGKDKPESFKTEPRSAWDKTDPETQEWMLSIAMEVTAMTSKQDIEGAYQHIESMNMDEEEKMAFWSRLDSTQRSGLKSYSAIIHAQSLDALERVWKAVPKHSIAPLTAVKDKRKADLAEAEGVVTEIAA